MTTRVVLVGDTHLPRFGHTLPEPLAAGLAEADLILHVGDITQAFVLELLARYARVEAVAGNNDPPELVERLGLRRVVEIEAVRIGLTHGHEGAGRSTLERARLTFAHAEPAVDAVAFGHSHQPFADRIDGVWFLNPGSPTDRRREPSFSYLRVHVDATAITPELVTYASWR